MQTQREEVGEATVMQVAGRLDSVTAPELDETLRTTLDQGVQALALDLTPLDYVSSAGLRVLLLAAKRLRASGTPFVLFGLQPEVATVFRISGFVKILPIAEDREAALASLKMG